MATLGAARFNKSYDTIGRAASASCPTAAFGAADLACTDLVPTPDLGGASAVLELLPIPTPFGVSVTVDGRPRQRLIATISGLPEPRALGAYSTYVAWAYSLTLDSAVKLGVVTNGRTDLGELDRNQFRVLISAERSPRVVARTGRLVLRGTSPSALLMAHRDLFQPVAAGALQDTGSATTSGMTSTSHRGMAVAGNTTRWPMPPMSPGMPTMPGMDGLTPAVAPFLPNAKTNDATIQDGRRRATIALRDGDTLTLEPRLVRRTIGGQRFVAYGYNGQYPGPLIEVDQGSSIVVRFHDAIDQPSTMHWHGVRLENPFDGVPGMTQPAVAPDGRFTYRVHFRDAGIYWYHPHVREDIQQNLGLYGNIVVRSHDPAYYARADREQVLMLSDLLLSDHGVTPYGAEAPTHALMGRFGNLLLVNGEPHYSLDVKRGEVVRFFLTNAANARIYNLSFTGARMKVIAGDVGKFEHEAWVPSVVIAPAERYVVDVQFATRGTSAFVNRVQALNHAAGTFSAEVDTLGLVRVARDSTRSSVAATFATLRRNTDVTSDIDKYRPYMSKPVDYTMFLTLRTHDLPAAVQNMLWGINTPVDWNDGMPMMNWLSTGKQVGWVLRDRATGKENMDIAWRFQEGDVVKLRLINDPSSGHAMDHPIHLHGQRFLVLSHDGIPNEHFVWKDTAIIPAGETVDLLVDLSNPGTWMIHCHIAEHLGSGMMAAFSVVPRTSRSDGDPHVSHASSYGGRVH
ncbi:MAG: multicopper oxidase family protein [Gemmatimonadota bacterium]